MTAVEATAAVVTAVAVTAAVAAEAVLSGRPAPDCLAVGAVAVANLTDRTGLIVLTGPTGPTVRIVPTGPIPA